MGTLASLYIKKETLKTLLDVLEKKQEKGLELTVSLSDDTNQYGQNVAAWVSQTKEQREEKKDRFYTGNGKVFWTDGTVKAAEKVEQADVVDDNNPGDSLPF